LAKESREFIFKDQGIGLREQGIFYADPGQFGGYSNAPVDTLLGRFSFSPAQNTNQQC
jgi:hypothetical protein